MPIAPHKVLFDRTLNYPLAIRKTQKVAAGSMPFARRRTRKLRVTVTWRSNLARDLLYLNESLS
jgi:hypothetical protein